MTEIALPEDRSTAIAPAGAAPPDVAVSALVLWAYEARQAGAIAESLAKTSFVPASLRGKPLDITAAILAGHELGLKPMATLRSMDVIQGTPALRAHAMRGLVQSNGHEVQLVGKPSPERVVMRGRRKGEQDWQEVEWTIQRAEQLGLTGKSEWKKQPQTMLIARATGEICRLIAADVLYAMPYASEELDGSELPEGGAMAAPRVTAQEVLRQAQPAPQLPREADRPDHVSLAEPAVQEGFDAPEGHEGPHSEWGYSAQCVVCQAQDSEAAEEGDGGVV